MKRFKLLFFVSILSLLTACENSSSDDASDTETEEEVVVEVETDIDISNSEFSSRTANCDNYSGSYVAYGALDYITWQLAGEPTDSSSYEYDAILEISYDSNTQQCTFNSNVLPNYTFNDVYNVKGIGFNNLAAAQSDSFSITTSPSHAASTTELSVSTINGIMLNGVIIDQLTGECWENSSGDKKCSDWRENPFSDDGNQFTLDTNNAHTQSDGTYHYHGGPADLFGGFVSSPSSESGVIGYAADGYPIFGPYFDDGTSIRAAVSGYELIDDSDSDGVSEGTRPGDGSTGGPGGTYTGKYRQDYEWDAAHGGDLDICNGMTVDGQYGYYVTEGFPYLMPCYQGEVHSSFSARSAKTPIEGYNMHSN